MSKVKLAIIFVSVLLFAACEQSTTVVTPSSDPKLASFSLRANDSIPALSTAVFTIDEPEDTGRVYNVDSLPYLTRIDSVSPYFRFNSTPALARAFMPNGDSIDLSGSDTLDFSSQPVRLFVVAADLKTTRWYNIFINVHQINPYLYTWRQLSSAIAVRDIEQQKALYFDGSLLWFVKDALGIDLYSSLDGATWYQLPVSLPDDLSVASITTFGYRLVAASTDGGLYYSDDALTWTYDDLSDQGLLCRNILFEFVDSLWVIAQDPLDQSLHLATSDYLGVFSVHSDPLPTDFPVEDYACATFLSRSFRPRAIVVGGYSAEGKMLNSRWNIEAVEENIRWTNYSHSRPDFPAIAGTQVVPYNDMLLMLGGLTTNNSLRSTKVYQSIDEGLSWVEADTASNALPATFTSRYRHSMFTDYFYNIYVVGGQSLTRTFSDVYTGRLGGIDFLE